MTNAGKISLEGPSSTQLRITLGGGVNSFTTSVVGTYQGIVFTNDDNLVLFGTSQTISENIVVTATRTGTIGTTGLASDLTINHNPLPTYISVQPEGELRLLNNVVLSQVTYNHTLTVETQNAVLRVLGGSIVENDASIPRSGLHFVIIEAGAEWHQYLPATFNLQWQVANAEALTFDIILI